MDLFSIRDCFASQEAMMIPPADHGYATRVGSYRVWHGGFGVIELEHEKFLKGVRKIIAPSLFLPQSSPGAPVSRRFGRRRAKLGHCTACSTGAHAVREASDHPAGARA